MSGFVGVLNLDNKPVDRRLLASMTGYMSFRGPDAQRVWCHGPTGLGHALLRTTRESKHEKQPFSLDGQVWIVADARVDGRADLVRDLRARDADVSLDTPDVELILQTYYAWGVACLERLIGDFGFALWDQPRQRLVCARDQFGVVPFFYARVANTIIVSNTLNCIRMHPDISDDLDEMVLADQMILLANQRLDAAVFSAIRRLPPAHTLIAERGTLSARRYWETPEEGTYLRYRDPEDYVTHFRTTFQQAVEDRLRTSRIAVELSGGMDTTSIAVLAHRLLSERGRSFEFSALTIDFKELLPDEESDYAALVAKDLGVPHYILRYEDVYLTPSADPPAFVPPEPPAPISSLTWYKPVSLLNDSHCRVLFSGHGGDLTLLPEPYHWRRLPQQGRLRALLTDLHTYGAIFGLRRPVGLGIRTRLRRWQGRPVLNLLPMPSWLSADWVDRCHLWEHKRASEVAFANGSKRRKIAEKPFWTNIFTWRDPEYSGLLLKSMYPFCDVRLFNLVLALPPIPWLHDKALLRLAMRDILPHSIIQRPKTPLTRSTNVEHTLALQRGPQSWQYDLAMEPKLAPYVDGKRLVQLLQFPQGVDHAGYRQVMAALQIAYWLRHQGNPRRTIRAGGVSDVTIVEHNDAVTGSKERLPG